MLSICLIMVEKKFAYGIYPRKMLVDSVAINPFMTNSVS